MQRCGWCLGDPLYLDYHDNEWGVPQYDDEVLFEFLLLEGVQAGLSWITVLRKRENYRKAFEGFNAEKIARYSDKKIEKLLQNPGIVRNRLKVNSAVNNARRYLDVKNSHDSFSTYLWDMVDGRVQVNQFSSLAEVPATTPVSDLMSKRLKKDGFNFVGSTICYAFMQATGMVNDHLITCHRHQACIGLA
ncbi:MAG: DNA-3-methyladenine glycosylase I [Pseudomonadales bacterium]|nr:DNA-3-methyladenine glycosylase I [Pseudomonadales bacterium]